MKSFLKNPMLIVGMVLLFVASSCGDDDGDSCNEIYTKIAIATGDLASPDCEVRVAGYDKLITLYGKGKNCKELKEDIEDEGYDSVDEFIAELQDTRDDVEADCNP